ncbi:fibronectin type 3 and ankyrin repeat domains 1 protein-like isoform X1 [Bolinopsis microptera]|uniref:fibronectin type 3 and ankyrin repeat domains 1 protein-like isoform X1 n=1 Tax=Bolinopsis microptera TaxID=2820187 RepID=UPI00307AAD03
MTGLDRPNPPVPGKVTHHSAELFWKVPKSKDVRISVLIQLCAPNEEDYETIYTGFGKKTEVRDLTHETCYKFRLRFTMGEENSDWSPVTEVVTKNKPMTGEDLHRVVTTRSVSGLKKLLADEDIAINAPDKMGNSPLMNACVKGYDDIAKILLDHNANMKYSNSAGKDSLMLACYHGNVNCVDALVEFGAKWTVKDKSGASPFHWAIDGGHTNVIEKILDETDNVDDPDSRSGWSPLMRLVTVNGSVNIAKMLIDKGADVNFKDLSGKPVLMAACLNGNKAMVELLVENGADLWTENEFGKTAYDMAKAFERRAVMKYIEEMETIYPRPPSMRLQAYLVDSPGSQIKSCPSSPALGRAKSNIQRSLTPTPFSSLSSRSMTNGRN